MSASSGIGSRLSRKRKNEDSSQSQMETALHDITDDFEDISTVFRLPKRSKVEKLLVPSRPRGRPKRSQPKRTPCDDKETCEEDDFSETSASTEDRGSQEIIVIDDNDCALELDESFLNKDEKLCRSCKHIVPLGVFDNHLKVCFQRFKLQRNTRSTAEPVPSCSNNQESKSKEKKSSAVQKKENLQILPCPLCLKPFKSRSQRQSHIKACGQKKGLSGEEVISAVRLQEKQAEERIQLGLPVIAPQSSVHEDKEKETNTVKGRGRGKKLANTKDPDLAMAIALSRSVAEEEAEKRASQEEKLLALGLDHIVEEDRKVKPVVLLPYASSSLNANKIKDKGRGTRGRRNFRNTVLATRSVAERERIISEKVAAILACDVTNDRWKENPTQGGRGRLSKFRDKGCTLWSTSAFNLEQPLEKYYVDDLEPYIKPKKVAVGRLLKRLSDIPGRLNVTVMQNVIENSDSESDVEEASVLEDYCTQLAMAELLGSQELNMTRANGSTSPDLSLQDDHQDPGSYITLEAASGFWLIHPAESKEDSSNEADEASKNREIYKEDDSVAKARVLGESKNSTKEFCVAGGEPANGDETKESCKRGGNSISSESSELVLKLDNSSCETACEQKSPVNSLSYTEKEDLGHLESSSCKNDSLASSFYNITSPKKMCRISLSGHILSGMCSDKQKGEDSLSQISDCSKEQILSGIGKTSLSVEKYMTSKLVNKASVDESPDNEIMCVLDTTTDKDTSRPQGVPKRLSRSQKKANQSGEPVSKWFANKNSKVQCSLNSMSPHMNYNTSSQEEALCSRRSLEEETPGEVGSLSDSSCDSDKTEVFGLHVGKNDSYDSDKTEVFGLPVGEDDYQNLDPLVPDCGSSIEEKKDHVEKKKQQEKDEDLNSKSFDCKSHMISAETTGEQSDRRESISADECNSPLLVEAEVPKNDNESDEEGSAMTLIYDDKVCDDEILSIPCSDKSDERNSDLEITLPLQNQEKKRTRASIVSKKSSDFQDKNDVTNVPSPQPGLVDMDETKTYVKGNLSVSNDSKTASDHNDSTVLYPPHIVKCLSQTTMPKQISENNWVPEQRDVKLGLSLPSEDYSKAGETAIHQILEAFEETIPSRYANTVNETVLNKKDVNAEEHVSSQDSNQLDDTLSDEMIDKLMETACNPPKSTTAVSLDETVVYEDSNDGDVTILHPVNCSPSKNSVALDNDMQVKKYLNCSSEKLNSKDTEGDKISSKDCDIRSSFSNVSPKQRNTRENSECDIRSSLSNVSPKQRNTRENSEMDKKSNSMRARLVYDWGSLLASGEESDVTIRVNDDEELNAHSIVLLARCPELYSDVKNSKRHITWNEVSYEGAYIFLVYLYTGDCTIKTKDDPLWMDVFDLALKYKSEELITFLESLYKIGNSPVKEGSSSLNGFEFSASKRLPKNSEPIGKTVEKNHTSGGRETRKKPEVDTDGPNSKMSPEKTSTVVRSSPTNTAMCSPLPRQISSEIRISPSHAALSTPKAEGGKNCGQRKLVRRCLDLSPIKETPSSKVLNSDESYQVDVHRIDSIISPSELNRNPKKEASSVYGTQSPDLFDSSVHDENVSFITTPAKSPPTISSPDVDYHSKESPKFSSSKDSPNLQNENDVQCNERSMCSENKQGPIYEEGGFHNQDERKDKNVIDEDSHISGSRSAKKGGPVDSVNHVVNGESDDIAENEKTDDVIDLTNDSSDESQSSFFATDDISNDNGINKKPVTSVSSQENMEPLKLVESEDSEKEVNELSPEGKNPDKKVTGADNEIVVDIICPSPGSVTSGNDDHKDMRSDKPENENSYVSNVWDDFDDVGCGISMGLPSTPDEDENLEEDTSFELPFFEKGKEIVDNTSDSQKELTSNNYVSGNVSQCSTSKSSPMAPPRSSNQKCLSSATSTVGIINSSRFDHEHKKARSCASSISDDTLVRIAGDIDNSNLWKEEFEPVFEDDGMVEEQGSDKEELMEHEKVKTPLQKARKKNMVTPLPNYKEMPSPDLQKELKRFGIKPISRRKAVVLLEHVYEKTHPLVTDSEADSSYCDTPLQAKPGNSKTGRQKASSSLHERVVAKNSKKNNKNSDDEPKKRAVTKTKNCKVSQVVNIHDRIVEEEEEEIPLNVSQSSSTSNEGSEGGCFEESMLVGDDDIATSATQKGCLTNQVTQFITSDPEFHQKVLLYEPFYVEDLLTSLKANGVKCNMRNVLDILDDQCITFRTHQGQRHRQRGRRCKRKSVGTPDKSPRRSKRMNQ